MQIQRYLSKVSGPLLDRIDLHVEVPPVKHADLAERKPGEPSRKVRDRVILARTIQRTRLETLPNRFCNADMESQEIQRFCQLSTEGTSLLRRAMESLGLSARAYDRILKVSRTIADLAGSDGIQLEHLSEAIQYRSLDRSMNAFMGHSLHESHRKS